MSEYRLIAIINGKPTFEKPLYEILSELKPGGALKILDPVEYITDRQRRWYKGVALPALVKWDENGESTGWWDDEVKRQCRGLDFLKKEIFYYQNESCEKIPMGRLTTKGVGVRNMTLFIEEILSIALIKGWPIGAPDPELRRF